MAQIQQVEGDRPRTAGQDTEANGAVPGADQRPADVCPSCRGDRQGPHERHRQLAAVLDLPREGQAVVARHSEVPRRCSPAISTRRGGGRAFC
jgi:hypothetical protein